MVANCRLVLEQIERDDQAWKASKEIPSPRRKQEETDTPTCPAEAHTERPKTKTTNLPGYY